MEQGGNRSGLQVQTWGEVLTHTEGVSGPWASCLGVLFFFSRDEQNTRDEEIKIREWKWEFMSVEGRGWVRRVEATDLLVSPQWSLSWFFYSLVVGP